MLDYPAWLKRAENFTLAVKRLSRQAKVKTGLAPPLEPKAMKSLEKKLQRPLPRPLRDFLGKGSARCAYRYRWYPPNDQLKAMKGFFEEMGDSKLYGGADLCDAAT